MREVKIFLGTIERVKDFVNAVTRLDCDCFRKICD